MLVSVGQVSGYQNNTTKDVDVYHLWIDDAIYHVLKISKVENVVVFWISWNKCYVHSSGKLDQGCIRRITGIIGLRKRLKRKRPIRLTKRTVNQSRIRIWIQIQTWRMIPLEGPRTTQTQTWRTSLECNCLNQVVDTGECYTS